MRSFDRGRGREGDREGERLVGRRRRRRRWRMDQRGSFILPACMHAMHALYEIEFRLRAAFARGTPHLRRGLTMLHDKDGEPGPCHYSTWEE